MTTTPRKAAAPRKPQDRLPKSVQLAAEATAPAGAEFMQETLAAWDQADATAEFLDLFEELGIDFEEVGDVDLDIKLSPGNVRIMGRVAKQLLKYAKDEPGLTQSLSGPGALSRSMDLAMWFFGQLGEADSSAN